MIISHSFEDLDPELMCHHLQATYWGKDLTPLIIELAFRHSFCTALFENDDLAGFCRAVSDRVTCAYIQDFLILPGYRRQGLRSQMLKALLDHPRLEQVERWYLGTKDAHGFYAKQGFKPSPDGIYMNYRSAPL